MSQRGAGHKAMAAGAAVPAGEGAVTLSRDVPRARRATIEARIEKAVERFRRDARGLADRSCTLCGYNGPFTPFGSPPRLDAQCAGCGALERHRLYGLLLHREGIVERTHRMLHFAAEAQIRKAVEPRVGTYETADLALHRRPTHRVNIEALDLPDGQYDRIVCNHVLEHVDDGKALSELFRVLKPGGLAMLTTPVCEGWAETYENADVEGRAARILHFGQKDHVRFYGRDLRDRIGAAGFRLEEFTAVEPFVRLHGLQRGETIFMAWKPEAEDV